jgi:hypothetical protein
VKWLGVDVRYGDGTIIMALSGPLEREDREAVHRMMEEAVRRGGRASERLEGEYAAYIEMPGTWLNIGFHGDEKTSEQIFIIPFRDGDRVKYFVVRGVSEGDRRVTGCDMVRIMGWDRLIEYLGEVWEEEGLGLAVREGWEVERALAERGRGDYYERVEGYCLTDGQGNIYVASVKWIFQVMGDGRRFWFEGLELGRAKVESVEEVVARITGGC